MIKSKVVVIGGPTASGKTNLALSLAKQINGEIISADSMQIYKNMDIGTAKITKNEMQGIPHYLIDIVYPNERYSVADFVKDALVKIEEIINKGKTPIVVGGTGLYIDSLINEIEFGDVKIDENYRMVLETIAENEGLDKLYNIAKQIDAEAITKISPNDKKRIMRILEIYHSTGKTKTIQEKESKKSELKYDYKVFAISMPKEELYERINKRVKIMIEDGLIQEVQNILKKYKEFPTAMQGLGYKEVVDYLENKYSKEEMIDKIQLETRHYAKRQITWFKRTKDLIWLDSKNTVEENVNIILEEVSEKS